MTTIFSTIASITAQSRQWHADHLSVGLVPTMGALHDGHLSLVRRARERCDRVITSIFVNPMQFGPTEDLDTYPRTFESDHALLNEAGCDALFTTTPAEMYPDPFSTFVDEEVVSKQLEGGARPSHFRGVLTVVTKLFHITLPDVAFFGQKDAQQAALIERMVRDLNFPVEVEVCPIVRESDGLAMSSRNRNLKGDDRRRATALHRAIETARSMRRSGERNADALCAAARAVLEEERDPNGRPFIAVDYVELVDPVEFTPVRDCERGRILIAARVGGTRLIDNDLLDGSPPKTPGRS